MKRHYTLLQICILAFLGIAAAVKSQNITPITSYTKPTLEERVTASDVVIEGRVISLKGFRNNKGAVYTAAIVRPTRLFKGSFPDSIIEIVYSGGQVDSLLVIPSNPIGWEEGSEGIFLLNNNETESRLVKEISSYNATFGPMSYIAYHSAAYMVAHHVATCKGETYDDLEKDLFRRIEKVTKYQPRIIGQNMFERKATKTLQGNK